MHPVFGFSYYKNPKVVVVSTDLFNVSRNLFGPFKFKLLNIEEKTDRTTNCHIRLKLMPIRLIISLVKAFRISQNNIYLHNFTTFESLGTCTSSSFNGSGSNIRTFRFSYLLYSQLMFFQ